MKAIEAIKSGSQLLRESKVESHILDSELLLAKILKKSREEILINLDRRLTKSEILTFNKYLNRDPKRANCIYFKRKRILEQKFFSE